MREEEMVVALAGMFFLFGLVWVIVRHCAWAFRGWHETSLKRDMVARGYTAQEIVAVMGSDRRCHGKSPLVDVPPAKLIRQPAY